LPLLWDLYLTAKDQGCRLSELLGIEDEYVALGIDRAATFLGGYIESEMRQIDNRVKNANFAQAVKMNRVRRILGLSQQFANPSEKG
jgi:hypothetical protein